MTDLTWTPVSGYGICYQAVVHGLILTTAKDKWGYYFFTAEKIASRRHYPPLTVYDSRQDAFCEQTSNPQRIKDVAVRWLIIREGQR